MEFHLKMYCGIFFSFINFLISIILHCLFLSILLSAMIVEIYRKGRYGEFILWMLFLVNYSVIHFKYYSVLIQVFLLACILLLRVFRGTERLNALLSGAARALSTRRVFEKFIVVFGSLVILLTGIRYCLKQTNIAYSSAASCGEAI